MDFQKLKSYFVKGDLRGAIEYMETVDELKDTVTQYKDIFEAEHYLTYDVPQELNDVLLDYQKYYRDVFYCRMEANQAKALLLRRLSRTLRLETVEEEVIEDALKALFESNGYNILTGDTQGYCGPYVWKSTEPTFYDVELPEGTAKYQVNILRGFVMCSWMDYLTFGQFGTGGWIGKDGVINCIESRYDFESERFRINMLKHEAQHAEDLKRWPDMSATDLEYRAKLVELSYSGDPELLPKFISEADDSNPDNSHAVANAKIASRMGDCVGKSVEEIQARAKELFAESNTIK